MTREERLIDYIKRFQGEGDDIYVSESQTHENTHGRNIATLRDGFSFLGWKIKINLERKGRNQPYRYGNSDSLEDSRFHPLFMCLNTAELILLAEALIKSKREPLKTDLLKMILKQLTPTALEMLKSRNSELEYIDHENFELRNRQESEVFTKDYLCAFFLKDDLPVKVQIKGTWITHTGVIKDVPGEQAIVIKTDREEIKIPVSQIVEITRLKRDIP
jgi:hypothetical protein